MVTYDWRADSFAAYQFACLWMAAVTAYEGLLMVEMMDGTVVARR